MVGAALASSVLLLSTLILVVSCAANVVPRGEYGVNHKGAFSELHNVMINPRDDRGLHIRGAVPHPRRPSTGNRSNKRNLNQTPKLDIRKVLLSSRQITTCESGYSLCHTSGRCCPDTKGNGRCCDDGTCTDSSDTCCQTGGACPSGQDCCENGCKPKENACCINDWNCDPGTFCCGDDNCAPNGGECCSNRTSCDKGLHCVILNGIEGCCQDLSCSEFDTSPNEDSSDPTGAAPSQAAKSQAALSSAAPSEAAPSIVVPSITLPAALSTGGLTAFPSISFPSVSIPAFTDDFTAVQYRWFTTTFTFYYYSYFITTIATPIPTSTRITTTTTFSVYASDSADASSLFAEVTPDLASISAISAPGFASATSPHTGALNGGGGTVATARPQGAGGSGASAGSRLSVRTGLLMSIWGGLAALAGAGMVLL